MIETTNPEVRTPQVPASYDVVGRYNQDEINGFPDDLIDSMLELAQLETAEHVLDAMAGNGNLSMRVYGHCAMRGYARPRLTMLEYSRIQKTFAETDLLPLGARVLWGDVMTMRDLETQEDLPPESFDRVLIKSALHELPLESQLALYQAVMRVLKPGGLFVTLGFLFEDREQRDEFREIARRKDQLAGLQTAAAQRHFLLREEYYSRLEQAGFTGIRSGRQFEYRIHSRIVAREYFSRPGLESAHLESQVPQLMALNLRRAGRVRFEGEYSVMSLPGEITVSRKPQAGPETDDLKKRPATVMRHIACHMELMQRASEWIQPGSDVLDLACGPGILAERLVEKKVTYRGVDADRAAVQICREQLGSQPGFEFYLADMERSEFGRDRYDCVLLLAGLHFPQMEPLRVLQNAWIALKRGGRLLLSGLSGPEALLRAQGRILRELEEKGLLETTREAFTEFQRSFEHPTRGRGSYWSIEGMLALLDKLASPRIETVDTEIYHGSGYLVVARK